MERMELFIFEKKPFKRFSEKSFKIFLKMHFSKKEIEFQIQI